MPLIPRLWREKAKEMGAPEKRPAADVGQLIERWGLPPIPAPDHKRRIADYAADIARELKFYRRARGE